MLSIYTPFFPMEPKSHQSPFDDAQYGFQIKWDGTRILAHVKQGKSQLFNRKKNVRTKQYPEISNALSDIFPKNDVILDGEIIALRDGKPNFQQLMRRDRASDKTTINYLMQHIPVTYVVFDIIFMDGRALVSSTFSDRDDILKSVLNSCDPIVVTDTFPARGILLYSIIKEKGLEGIVAKKLNSLYEIGKKSGSWLKIKNRRQIMSMVGGFLADGANVKSLLLGTKEDDELVYIGNASSGITEKQAKSLYENLCTEAITSCPFMDPPKHYKTKNIRWVNPIFEVVIEYSDFTDDGLLRHPVIKELKPPAKT
jgi:bifunctional non-homologous end joining protein LigD